ncbi:hypothetical membrane protein [Cryobacterium flavum]|uniref:DUF998 domain-containing protein n=1 Tax=Cryobacterium flavum TaxID=1424659 RepID=A0A4R8V3K0_9MICO|nr:DUF998 domain-containing protein [Cryobacterium flavum]TFB76029.1 DUF998 domain-containing protein [Cryobacterium flavum]SDO03470.1 hypothetical membrane protein [Cryobacterium flavum]
MAIPGTSTRRLRVVRHSLATVAMVGVVLYVLIDVVLQFLPPHYSPISDAESNLAVGPYGWIMNLNFLGRAVFCVAVVVAIALTARALLPRRRDVLLGLGLALLLIGGASSAVLAVFPTDISASHESTLQTSTTVGVIHLAVASFGFVTALIAIGLLTIWLRVRGLLPRVLPWAIAFSAITLAGLLLVVAASVWLPGIVGLAERVALVGILGWTLSVSAGIRRRPNRQHRQQPDTLEK